MARKKPDNELEAKIMAMASKVTPVNLSVIKHNDNGPPSVLTLEDCTVVKVLNIKTPNPLNLRRHWAAKYKTSAQHLQAVAAALADVEKQIRDELAKGCIIRLVRGSAGKVDSDALPGCLKHVRDGVAAWLLGGKPGQMDDDERITWEYGMAKAQQGKPYVIINIKKRR